MPRIDDLPGFRRRIVVLAGPDSVCADVEDDYHRMGVVITHDGTTATTVTAQMARVPWTTCPGAPAVLAGTFTGVALDAFAKRGAKRANCTHLFDLALLAAAHARDLAPLVYDLLVSDPVRDERRAVLRRDAVPVLEWTLSGGSIVSPLSVAGLSPGDLSGYVATLDAERQEWVRLLRLGIMLAHGRERSYAGTDHKGQLPYGQCFTFQPERAGDVQYISGTIRDFSGGSGEPLAKFDAGQRRAAARKYGDRP